MIFRSLNPQQKSAVFSKEKPLLIVAGAGTGKTKTLTCRLIYLLQKGISPKNICAITFTNKAAEEMKNRVFSALKTEKGINSNDLFIGTFHSLGAKILRQEAPVFDRNKNFVIFDEDDSFSLIKLILKNENKKREGPSFFKDKISKIKNNILSFSEIEDNPQKNEIINIYEKYEKKLKEQNAFDFDDLIQKTVLLFKKDKNVLEKYQNRFQYILVDEYQDINNIQYELIYLLAQKFKNINVVGDDAQTIYSWRGSNIEIFLSFEKDWPGAEIVFLEENYRSTSNILSAASAVISKNVYQKPKKLWTKNGDGEPIKIIEVKNEDEEALWVSEKIKELLKEKKSIGVLYRTNAQSRSIEEHLNAKSIPYKIFGSIRFYERKEIKDILAVLRLIENPYDEISRERIKKTFTKTIQNKIFEIINSQPKNASPQKLINLFLKNTNYLNYIERNFLNFKERFENIEELMRLASLFNNLKDFLEKIALSQPHDEHNEKEKKNALVELMTIHLAKGLEFDCVFIIGACEGILPHKLSYYNQKEMEEERRLMYVAMTRARKDLFISFYKEPSRFLFDIPQDLISFISLVMDKDEFIDDEKNYIHIL
jgi:DNA helicase-2/ATP-dependent DNA helicase PcrA